MSQAPRCEHGGDERGLFCPLCHEDMKYASLDDLEIHRFFDELQAHIVVAGGRKLSHNQLKDKPLEQIVRLIWPNGIRLKVTRE
jgi:hypothetical protein